MELTKKQAREFLIQYHNLHKRTPKNFSQSKRKEAILDHFSRHGCIQYDPLNVVGRNPDLVLQARIGSYNHSDLSTLLYQDKKLIDAWDKMMSIYPTSDWPYFKKVRIQHGQGTLGTLKYRNSLEALELNDQVLAHIKTHGPSKSSDFKSETATKGKWGHSKLTSASLDYLYSVGTIGVTDKTNTQKVYDLIEHIVPQPLLNTDIEYNHDHDYIDWYLYRRIKGAGLVWNKNGGHWLGYYIQKKATRSQSISRLLDKNLISTVRIKGISEPFYITSDNLSLLETPKKYKKQVRFLAPLDNFLWDRGLIEILFDFHYRWEVYTPIKKRIFGYYVLPILFGHQIVGRIEFDYYRKGKSLKILNRWFEPWFKETDTFKKAFNLELECFNRYLESLE